MILSENKKIKSTTTLEFQTAICKQKYDEWWEYTRRENDQSMISCNPI